MLARVGGLFGVSDTKVVSLGCVPGVVWAHLHRMSMMGAAHGAVYRLSDAIAGVSNTLRPNVLCGQCAKSAVTLERDPCEAVGRWPSQLESAVRAGCFTRAWAGAPPMSGSGWWRRVGARYGRVAPKQKQNKNHKSTPMCRYKRTYFRQAGSSATTNRSNSAQIWPNSGQLG